MPLRVSRTWSNIACLALTPLCLAAAQAGSVQGVASDAVSKPPVVTESGPVANGWQITAKADKHDYLPGEPVKVSITLKNVAGEDQRLADSDFDGDFEFAVICNGVETPATEYGVENRQRWIEAEKRLHSHSFSSWPGLIFGPFHSGQTKTYTLAVSRFRDMSFDGTYKIIVKRETDSRAQLVANPVYVQVGRAGAQ